MDVKRTERGWAGHFILADRCRFRRNTLLEYSDIKIVVSTVGLLWDREGKCFDTVGVDGYFETQAFHADPIDLRYHDIEVSKQVYFESPWRIDEIDADDKANDMHERVVDEITQRLKDGDTFESP